MWSQIAFWFAILVDVSLGHCKCASSGRIQEVRIPNIGWKDVFNKLKIDGVEGGEFQYIRKNSNGIHPVTGKAIGEHFAIPKRSITVQVSTT